MEKRRNSAPPQLGPETTVLFKGTKEEVDRFLANCPFEFTSVSTKFEKKRRLTEPELEKLKKETGERIRKKLNEKKEENERKEAMDKTVGWSKTLTDGIAALAFFAILASFMLEAVQQDGNVASGPFPDNRTVGTVGKWGLAVVADHNSTTVIALIADAFSGLARDHTKSHAVLSVATAFAGLGAGISRAYDIPQHYAATVTLSNI